MTDFPAAPTLIEVTPVETGNTNPLHVVLARRAWLENPRVTVSYDPAEDTLILRFVILPSTYSMSTDEPLFAGFDALGEGAWPTTIAVSSASQVFFEQSRAMTNLRHLIGEMVCGAVSEVLDSAKPLTSTVELTVEQGFDLHLRWDAMTTVLDAMSAEAMTDDILKTVLLSWTVELAPALLRDGTAKKTIDPKKLPESIRRSAAVTDDALFQRLVGRKRRPVEPWSVARLDLDHKGEDYLVSVVIPLPQGPAVNTTVSADITINDQTWNVILEKDEAQDRVLSRKLVGCRLIPAEALMVDQGEPAENFSIELKIHATPADPS
ncbi:hypothetical protein [Arthrobacter sp. H14-L1]|uniref:hypothetical protein n=1 Tax=Arthrobacter sp. H14-L1 TaxID=2996697 RepID=UPI00226EA291|nr:hypothetical protein [Arthrobacter sp. H14-L1]MCY0905761.1 hypothetical protein [Arthrobacter sp. H14-L1]